jgi:hypothetical protein
MSLFIPTWVLSHICLPGPFPVLDTFPEFLVITVLRRSQVWDIETLVIPLPVTMISIC